MERITIIVHDITGCAYDVEVPLDITASELIFGLHTGLNHAGECPAALRCENPTAFLTGEKTLSLFGLRDGSNIYYYGDDRA